MLGAGVVHSIRFKSALTSPSTAALNDPMRAKRWFSGSWRTTHLASRLSDPPKQHKNYKIRKGSKLAQVLHWEMNHVARHYPRYHPHHFPARGIQWPLRRLWLGLRPRWRLYPRHHLDHRSSTELMTAVNGASRCQDTPLVDVRNAAVPQNAAGTTVLSSTSPNPLRSGLATAGPSISRHSN